LALEKMRLGENVKMRRGKKGIWRAENGSCFVVYGLLLKSEFGVWGSKFGI